MILVSLHGADPLPNALTAAGVPTILSGRPRPDQHLPFVDADNRGGAHAATRHLLGQGRTRVATITGPLDMMAAVDRFDGYKDALRDAGHLERKNLMAHGDFTEESGERATRSLLRRNPAIDAVFVASDAMALGALRALDATGRRVPDDVAVVGFDDIGVAATATPPLTSVRQPLTEMTRPSAPSVAPRSSGTSTRDSRPRHIDTPHCRCHLDGSRIMASVTFDHATRMYPKAERPAVDAFDLHIPAGEFIVLVGPSGCGKSTCLRMLAGLEPLDDGSVFIGDVDVSNLPPKERDVAMVFQSYALYPHLTVAENMGFALKIAGVPKHEIHERVAEAARLLDLEPLLNRKTGGMSGGQRQRSRDRPRNRP